MDIIGHPNYQIYPDGRVWSKNGRGRFLKSAKNKDSNYEIVSLHTNNKLKTFTIHRLVAIHYIPNPNDYPCVDHTNRIRDDNRIENLRWASYYMNNQNRSISKSNTSGHSSIGFYKKAQRWKFQKNIFGQCYSKCFISKIDCICYKYIFLLKVKTGLYKKNSFSEPPIKIDNQV